MTFFFKIGLGLLVLVGGSVLLVNNVPSLKANIVEAINPRAREQRLIDQLKSNLQALDASIATQDGAPSISVDKAKPAYQKLITESKELLSEIDAMNDEHSGVVDGIISKAADLIIGNATTSPTPQSTASATPANQSGSQPVVVTVTVTPVPSPCD